MHNNRVSEQAGGLADELAQSQHQAELEEQHAQELQSEAISSKIHLMQEAERLTQELQQMTEKAAAMSQQASDSQAEVARLQAALQEVQVHIASLWI